MARAWATTGTRHSKKWYVNCTRGLEHGYTVRQRLVDHEDGMEKGPLTFTLAIRGALRPEVADDGQSVLFVDKGGTVVLTYTGLRVSDADGVVLDASFALTDPGICLSVDERGARYPLTIDPIAQQAYLKGHNTRQGDNFGWSAAVSGDTVVVGARSRSCLRRYRVEQIARFLLQWC